MEERPVEKTENFIVDLPKIIKALWRKAWLIMLVALLAAALSVGMAKRSFTQSYRISAVFCVVDDDLTAEAAVKRASYSMEEMAQFYIVILHTQDVLENVIDNADIGMSSRELSRMLSAEPVDDTSMFQISVTGKDPAMLERILDALITVLPATDNSDIANFSCKCVYSDEDASWANSPSYTMDAVTGFVVGWALSVGLIVLGVVFDKVIRSENDLKQTCAYPILGTIPVIPAGTCRKSLKKPEGSLAAPIGEDVGFAAEDAYKLLRTKLQFAFGDDGGCRVIGITGACTGEGKSLTAINLAYELAQLEKMVVLIDCDMRCSAMAQKLSYETEAGLSDYLSERCLLEDVLQVCNMRGADGNLRVISAGHTVAKPMELLSSDGMRTVLETMRKQCDYVVLNLPPLGVVSDAMVVSKMTDGILLVVRQNYSNREAVAHAVEKLESIQTKILGVVLNGTTVRGCKRDAKYYAGK